MNLQQSANEVLDRGEELFRHEQYKEALPAFEEACTLYRQLAATQSPEFELNIISSLNNIGICRSRLASSEKRWLLSRKHTGSANAVGTKQPRTQEIRSHICGPMY